MWPSASCIIKFLIEWRAEHFQNTQVLVQTEMDYSCVILQVCEDPSEAQSQQKHSTRRSGLINHASLAFNFYETFRLMQWFTASLWTFIWSKRRSSFLSVSSRSLKLFILHPVIESAHDKGPKQRPYHPFDWNSTIKVCMRSKLDEYGSKIFIWPSTSLYLTSEGRMETVSSES